MIFVPDQQETMNETDVARLWEENAEAWTMLARMGCDVYRDFVITLALT